MLPRMTVACTTRWAARSTVALILLSLGVAACGPSGTGEHGSASSLAKAREAANRASAYLWAAQGNDGGWHSPVHGIARGGHAWTPYVLYVLAGAGADAGLASSREPGLVGEQSAAGIAAGLRFIRGRVDDGGALGRGDGFVLEYPNYATAYALMVLSAVNDPADARLRARMRAYLLDQQWTEQRGITPDHPAYGSWGFGETAFAAGSVGHVDLSHTRRVLQAIQPAPAEVNERALLFLGLVQRANSDGRAVLGVPQTETPFDGGFYSSPVVYGVNKAGIDTTSSGARYFRSYATTTCDGVMAMLAAGVGREEAPVAEALRWLRDHPALDRVAGIPESERGQWEDVMFFYHLNARAEVLRLEPSASQLLEIERLLLEHQHEDGSFSNPVGGPNKEDDPVLATAFALSTLQHTIAARSLLDATP